MRRLFLLWFLVLLGSFSPSKSLPDAENELLRSGQPSGASAQEGQQQLEDGQFEKAVVTLTNALQKEGDSPRLRYLLGRAYYEQRNFDDAIKQFEQAVKGDARNSMVHLWLGRAYGRKAERSSWFTALRLAGKLRREFETAIQLDPQNLEARRDILEFYLEAPGIVGGGHEKARAEAEEMAKRDPSEGHRAWANYWDDHKQYDQAEAEWKKALDAKPSRPDAYFELVEFYRTRGRFADMLPIIPMLTGRFGNDRRVPYYAAESYILNDKELDEAQKLLEKYIAGPVGAEDPSRAQAHVWLGRLYEKKNEPARAEEQYRQALKLEPDMKEAKQALRQLRKKK